MRVFQRLKDHLNGKAPVSARRSSRWPHVRAEFLKKNPHCKACGGQKKLEVHHIRPFHEAPELELDEANLIPLCESWNHGINCHLAIGHNGSYRRSDPNVRSEAQRWLDK